MDAYISQVLSETEARKTRGSTLARPAKAYRQDIFRLRAGIERKFHRPRSTICVSRSPELTRREVVWRPWTADQDLAVLQLPSGAGIAVLVAFDRFLVDKMGDIDKHAAGFILAATNFLFKRMEELVYLNRQGSGLGLALAVTGGLFP